ncbi:MAG TPA: TetR/AcrR family transcriptional regulator [Spirochaetia bacterium]|nr:TetR/AcrR family transcriptional regulator [Spirochaetia bacterium]
MEVRERVFNAMAELARSRGLHAITMDELAEAAGVSKRTVYRYFPGKEQVVEGMIGQFALEVESGIAGILAGGARPREKLRLLATHLHERLSLLDPPSMADLQRHYPAVWQKLEDFRSQKVMLLEGLITEGIACGDFRRVDPALAASAFLGMARTIITPAFILNHSLSIAEALQMVFDLFLYGLTAPPPKELP